MIETIPNQNSKIFVSYSRRDSSEFAKELVAGLELAGFEPFLDQQSISAGEDWQAQLGNLIAQSDAIVFVVSPDAIKSERCDWEVNKAIELAKRIVPVIHKPVPDADIPEKLRRLQFIRFDEGRSLARQLTELAAALRQDLDWIREHTRIGELATRWEERDKPESQLLRGDDLVAARAWQKRWPRGAPEITQSQQEYLTASEDAEIARLDRERRQVEEVRRALELTKRSQRRIATLLLCLGCIVVIGGAIVAWQVHTNSTLRASLDSRQQALDHTQANQFARLAVDQRSKGNLNGALRFSILGVRYEYRLGNIPVAPSFASAELAKTASQSWWQLVIHTYSRFATFNGDGSQLVIFTGAAGYTEDAEGGRSTKILVGHYEGQIAEVSAFAVSANGERAFAENSGIDTIPIFAPHEKWDSRTAWDTSGTTAKTLDSPQAENADLFPTKIKLSAFSPEGSRLAFLLDGTIQIHDTATQKQISLITRYGSAPQSIGLGPHGNRLLVSSGNSTKIFDVSTRKEIAALDMRGNVLFAVYSNDGKRILTTSDEGKVVIWDAASAKPIGKISAHKQAITFAAFSRDDKLFATASKDKTAGIWDVENGEEIAVLRGHQDDLLSATFSPDGSKVVTTSKDETVRVWDISSTIRLEKLLQNDDSTITTATFSRDGTKILTGSKNSTARVWDTKSGAPVSPPLTHTDSIKSVAYSRDGSYILTSSYDMSLRIWDAKTYSEQYVLHGQARMDILTNFRPANLKIVTDTTTTIATHIGFGDEEDARQVIGNDSVPVAFSPDGKLMATKEKSHVVIKDVATKKTMREIGLSDIIRSVAFSPQGRRLVVAAGDNATICDVNSGRTRAVLKGHTGVVTTATFSPDGHRVLTSAEDATTRIWDAGTGNEIAVIHGTGDTPVTIFGGKQSFYKHGTGVQSAVFSPDGHRIVAASDFGARIWEVSSATATGRELVSKLCKEDPIGLSKLTRDEMRLAGYPEDAPEIVVCNADIN